MFLGNAVVANQVPADLLAPFAPDDQRMIQQEAAADPAFARLVSDALSRPGGPQWVAQSARKAIANELNPKMYPESAGTWPVLRRMTDELSASTASDVIAKVDQMTFPELVNAVEGIAAHKRAPGVHGLGQASQAASSLSVVGGLASGLANAGAAIYTTHVMATTMSHIASIQANVLMHTEDVSSQIARAHAAMAAATAAIDAIKLQQSQVALQQSQVDLQRQQLAAQQAQQTAQQPDQSAQQAVPDQVAVDSSISTASPSPYQNVTPAAPVPRGPRWQVSWVNPSAAAGRTITSMTWDSLAAAQTAADASRNAGMPSVSITVIPATPGWFAPPAQVTPGPQPTALTPPPPPQPPMPPMESSPVTTMGPASTAPIPDAVVITRPPPAAPSLAVPLLVAAGGGAALLYHFLGDHPAGGYMGKLEVDTFSRLSKPVQHAIAMEAQAPAFVTGYLLPVLRGPNPEARILSDIAHEVHMADMYGMGYLGRSFWKKVVQAVKKVTRDIPVKVIKWTTPKVVQKLAKKVGKPVMKVWHKYGAIILSVVGGILAFVPFIGPVLAIAMTVLAAAQKMYEAKKAAEHAFRTAKVDAGHQQAAADVAQGQVQAQVDTFYNTNQPWFLGHDITPASWAQLTLDQKIAIINAGVTGTLPAGAVQVGTVTVPASDSGICYGQPGWTTTAGYAIPTPPPHPGGSTTTPPSPQVHNAVDTTTSTAPNVTSTPTNQQIQQATQSGGGIPVANTSQVGPVPVSPPAYSTGGGGGGGGGAPTDGGVSTDSSGGAAPPIQTAPGDPGTQTPSSAPAPAAPAGTYDVVVEGQKVATVGSLNDASTTALQSASTGDRFEIMLNGQTTGLKLRTSKGSIAVPANSDAQVRALTHAQVVALVQNAEQQAAGSAAGTPAAAASGGTSYALPALIAGAVAIAFATLGGKKH